MTTSIMHRFREWVERDPDRLLYRFLDADGRTAESYTYAAFLQRTTDIASHIRSTSPLAPGQRVLLAYPPGVEMICALFACVRLGLIPVPVYPPAGGGFRAALGRTDYIARDCDAAAVLTSRSYYWSMRVSETRSRVATLSLRRSGVSKLRWIVTTDAERGVRADFADAHSDVLFLQYTSGSTRDPRGVMVTHANILHNCDAVVDHQPVGVSWLPQYHDMGLIGYYIFFALKGGTTYGFSPVDFIKRPALWLETISRYRGTASSAPNFAYEYCLRPGKIPQETLEQLDLSSLRFLMTAAEPVRAGVYREFLRSFQPYGLEPRAFFAAYGLAEHTLAVSNYGSICLDVDRAALRRGVVHPAGEVSGGPTVATIVSCGRPLDAVEVQIVDVTAAARPAGAGRVGEIWLRGPSKCAGYWGRPDLNATTFEARLDGEPADATTWLRTGDLGFLHDGELFVCGRAKDMLIVNGLNYYPHDIEAIVQDDPHVRKGCVVAFGRDDGEGETLVVVAEVRSRTKLPDARALNVRLLRELGIAAASFFFIGPRSIAKTSSGKVMRYRVRELCLAGQLDVVAQGDTAGDAVGPASDAPAIATPSRALLSRFGLTGTESWTLADAGFDSLRLAEFSHALKTQLENAGEHDLSRAVDLRVLQKIAICELFDLLDQVATSEPHARLRLARALSDLDREHRTLDAELMGQDTRLRFDFTAPAAAGSAAAVGGGILLTGGTGFFGPFLLRSLLDHGTEPVHVLVRADEDTALQRIRDGLASAASDGSLPDGWECRVRPLCGDLAAPHLGLSATAWQALAEEVHTVYHNGAAVNYLLDYRAMRDANVGGTNEVVRLAMNRRPKILNYISTTFIFGWSVQATLAESDTNADMERLDFGYSQSKWVSEHVVRDAMTQGLQARIFRPALLTPSLCGGGSSFDISMRLLAFMLRHGISTSAQNQVSFTPVDVAAHNIVAISGVPESLGATCHVTRDEHTTLDEVAALLRVHTGQCFRSYPLRDFVPEVIGRCRPGDVLFPLLEFLVRSVDNIAAMEFKRYDNSNYRRFRAAADAGIPDPPLSDVVSGIVRFMRKHGLLEV